LLIGQNNKADNILDQTFFITKAAGYSFFEESKTKKIGYNKSRVTQNTSPIQSL
jgi:hypothetical protein